MSVGLVDTGDHTDLSGLNSPLRSLETQWSRLPLNMLSRAVPYYSWGGGVTFAVCAVTRNHE